MIIEARKQSAWQADRIDRVVLHGVLAGNAIDVTNTAAPMAAALKADYPEVRAAVREFGWSEAVGKTMRQPAEALKYE